MSRTRIHSDDAPKAVGPYSQAIQYGDFVFCAGQVGIDPTTGKLVEGGSPAQTHRALENLKAVLKAGGSGMEHVVKTTVFLADMDDFKAMNEVYAGFFPNDPPARSTFAVKGLPLGALVEIEAIAVRKE